jgi:hypothetical protein
MNEGDARLDLGVGGSPEATQDHHQVEAGLDGIGAPGERVAVGGLGLGEPPAARLHASPVTARRELVHRAAADTSAGRLS